MVVYSVVINSAGAIKLAPHSRRRTGTGYKCQDFMVEIIQSQPVVYIGDSTVLSYRITEYMVGYSVAINLAGAIKLAPHSRRSTGTGYKCQDVTVEII